jgi:tRNA threonylcarbamoyladenosine biosynthesis protein TsaB
MIILAIDTASTTGSVAVVDDEMLLAEITVARRETHSRRLMNMIDDALDMAGLSMGRVDGFVFTKGPGSFTGLRIGLSIIKALALAAAKPLVGISSLEVLAHQASEISRLICPMMDARNKELYCARYRFTDGGLVPVTAERACTPEECASGIIEPCLLIGDGAHRYRSFFESRIGEHARFAAIIDGVPRASTAARLGLIRFKENQTDCVQTVVPVYLRKSYAEPKKAAVKGAGV